MNQTSSRKPVAPPACQIVGLVIGSTARGIVKQFREGASTRTIARVSGLSRGGVEEIIRAYGWLKAGRKPATSTSAAAR